MDRSFLSHDEIIKASRDYVCIRTATYEDKEEAAFLKSTFLGRDGDLRNFGYCILSPDGKTKLRRSDRGPNFVYSNAGAMAADLRQIAKKYSGETTIKKSSPGIPEMKSVRLGINVASCDGLPSIVVFGQNQTEVDQMKKKLGGVIWDEVLAGKFIYASTTEFDDLKTVSGVDREAGFLVIKPDVYGLNEQLQAGK